MKQRTLVWLIVFIALVTVSISGQDSRQLQTLDYEKGTMRLYERAIRAYLKQDFARAEEMVMETLRNEPDMIEARWLLANTYQKTGRLGLMMETLAELGIRERVESEYFNELVTSGSTGYVLSQRNNYITIDLTEQNGAAKGARYVVYLEGDILRHPVTLTIVDVEQPARGIVEIVEVMETHSIATIEESRAPLERGMRVINEAEYERFFYDIGDDTELEEETSGPVSRIVPLDKSYDGGPVEAPEGFAVDQDGNIVVADTGNDRIIRVKPDGELVDLFGRSGSGTDELRAPVSVALRGDEIYVVERSNHRLHRVATEQLEHIGVVGSRGLDAPGMFTVPQKAVVVGEEIFVLDPGNSRIQIIDENGGVAERTITDDAVGDNPTSFTVGTSRVYLLDAVSGVVHRFNRSAPYEYLGETPVPEAVIADSSIVDITAFVMDSTPYLALVLDEAGEVVITDSSMSSIETRLGVDSDIRFTDPVRVKFVDGELYVLERGAARVQVVADFL